MTGKVPEMDFLRWAHSYDANLVRLVHGNSEANWQKFEAIDRDIIRFILSLTDEDRQLILQNYQETARQAEPEYQRYYVGFEKLDWSIMLPAMNKLVDLVKLIRLYPNQATELLDKLIPGHHQPGFPHHWYVNKWHQQYGNPGQSMILYNMMDPMGQRKLRRYLFQ